MASVVDICNLALAHLGDPATVASIDPPEGSAQAEHCARFYPPARDALLEMHTWGFATRRAPLALLEETNDQWDYVYAWPNLAQKIIAVIPPDASDDYFIGGDYYAQEFPDFPAAWGSYSPQRYAIEALSTGQRVVVTNCENAVVRYIETVTDPMRFSPLFVQALSWMLAAQLAGPIIKGELGAAEAKRALQMAQMYMSEAKMSDSNQRAIKPGQVVPWMAGR
jgi:hypothetical protein